MKGISLVLCLIFFFVVVNSSTAQVNLQNGLVAYYPFDGNVSDLSGNNHNGTVVNGLSFGPNRFGDLNSAAAFSGNNNYISIPDNGAFSTSQISISLWFQSTSDNLQNLIGKRKFGDDGTPSGGAQYQFFINYAPFPGIGSNLVGNNSTCANTGITSYLNTGQPICRGRWYHAVITYDGTFHKIYINGLLVRSEQVSFTSFLNCTSELRFGVWWSKDMIPFIGSMDEVRWYNRAINQAEVNALYDNFITNTPIDFTFTQQVCSPKTVQFSAINISVSDFKWNFGNGSFSSAKDPLITFDDFGDFEVELAVNTSQNCVEKISKIVPVRIGKGTNILTNDTTICVGNSLQLATDSGFAYCWSPDPSILNVTTANVLVKPTQKTVYFLTTLSSGTSLIVNGDFDKGNTGFSSDYKSSVSNTDSQFGFYAVTNNAKAWNPSLATCTNNSSGNGNALIINNDRANAVIWKQQVKVEHNKNYVFSFNVQSLFIPKTVQLQMSINNKLIGNVVSSWSETCTWKEYSVTWNSGNADSVPLMIVNKYNFPGTFAAIDDIVFKPVNLITDSVTVNVLPAPVIKSITDTTVCAGSPITLFTTGGTIYNWLSGSGLVNTSQQNPVVFPTTSTQYVLSGFTTPGCTATDTVNVTVYQKIVVNLTKDTIVCEGTALQLYASGGTTYEWSPARGLNANNVNDPIVTLFQNSKYLVKVTDVNGCKAIDSVSISLAPLPFVKINTNNSICAGQQTSLTTSATAGVNYQWSPSVGLSSAIIANPIAVPTASTKYIVVVSTINKCKASDSISLSVLPVPSLFRSNDTTVCAGISLPLFVSGGSSYQWSPNLGLSNTQIPNPIASINIASVYKVLVTSNNGCQKEDSIRIGVRERPVFRLTPTAAAICKNDTISLRASGGDKYEWSTISAVFSPDKSTVLVKPLSTTRYSVKITESVCNIIDTLNTTINVNLLPNVSLTKSNDIDCFTPSAKLIASGSATYKWLPIEGLTNPNVYNPVATPANSTVYTVKATDRNGCSDTASIMIDVKFNGNGNTYNLPTAFTPNNDGLNDCFGLKYWGNVTGLEFSIFNRWGERIFFTSDPAKCWDGNYKGVPQNSGAFVYVIKAKTVCAGDILKKGAFVLIR